MKKVNAMVMILFLMVVTAAWAETPYQIGWSRQFGTTGNEEGQAVADSSNNVYVGGETTGSLGGTSAGGYDAYLRKYDSMGNALWSSQIGTAGSDWYQGVAMDSTGNAYAGGYTTGNLAATNAGGNDGFLTKHDGAGNLSWSRQIGTSGNDYIRSVSVDHTGNIYVSGETSGSLYGTNHGSKDAFLAKYDANGIALWGQQIGTSSGDSSWGVSAADTSGNAYITGWTQGSLGGANKGNADAFLAKYDSAGNQVWTKQIGTSMWDYSNAVAVDSSGDVYISGYTSGSLGGTNKGSDDAFLCKYDAAGNLIWSRQFGTSSQDQVRSLALDSTGNIFIAGETYGSLGGPNAGSEDAFLTKYDATGNYLWTQQIGTSGDDYACSVAVDAFGNPYLSGYTTSDLYGPNAGGLDAFVVQFAVPEPVTLTFLAIGGLALVRKRR